MEHAIKGGFDFITTLEGEKKDIKLPFLTENFFFSITTTIEIFSVIALVSLPFVSCSHTTTTNENHMQITPGSNLMLFVKELIEKENQTMNLDIPAVRNSTILTMNLVLLKTVSPKLTKQ